MRTPMRLLLPPAVPPAAALGEMGVIESTVAVPVRSESGVAGTTTALPAEAVGGTTTVGGGATTTGAGAGVTLSCVAQAPSSASAMGARTSFLIRSLLSIPLGLAILVPKYHRRME